MKGSEPGQVQGKKRVPDTALKWWEYENMERATKLESQRPHQPGLSVG